jgi:hypothetical protein
VTLVLGDAWRIFFTCLARDDDAGEGVDPARRTSIIADSRHQIEDRLACRRWISRPSNTTTATTGEGTLDVHYLGLQVVDAFESDFLVQRDGRLGSLYRGAQANPPMASTSARSSVT